jgi:decaprenyl-phosphate phosphoribosyltransferase
MPKSNVKWVSIIRLLRPKQWLKNSLVLLSPLMAGTLINVEVFLSSLLGVLSFILASSGIYVFNDFFDREMDRQHPEKKKRPIAAAEVSSLQACILIILLFSMSIFLPVIMGRTELGLVIILYLTIQVAYCLGLKNWPTIDVALIASGFILRAVGGGIASEAGVSIWFLLVVGFGSFYISVAKRLNELSKTERLNHKLRTRIVLEKYSEAYLQLLLNTSITSLIVFYCLWASQLNQIQGVSWPLLSIVPLILAVFRYQYEVNMGRAEFPENVVIGDRQFMFFVLIWLGVVVSGLYFN